MSNSIRYIGGSKERKQNVRNLLNTLGTLKKEIKDTLMEEFPRGTKVSFKRGTKTVSGEVYSVYVGHHTVGLRIILNEDLDFVSLYNVECILEG